MPSVVPAAASGTTTRLAAMPTSESWLKWASMTGVTAAWAPTLTATAVASQRRPAPRREPAVMVGVR